MKKSLINTIDADQGWWKLPKHIDDLLKEYNDLVVESSKNRKLNIEEYMEVIRDLNMKCKEIATKNRDLLSQSLEENSNYVDLESFIPPNILDYFVELIQWTTEDNLNLLNRTSELNHTRRLYSLMEKYFTMPEFSTNCNVAFEMKHPEEGTFRPDLIGLFRSKIFLLEEDKPDDCVFFDKHEDFKKIIYLMRYTFKHLLSEYQLGVNELRVFGFLWGGCYLHVLSMESRSVCIKIIFLR